MLDAFSIDIRFGIRRLFKNRLFTLAAVVPMALGIGVSTAMFTVGDALLRKPLAIPGIDRLVGIVETPPDRKAAAFPATLADYIDLDRQNRSFDRIAAYRYEDHVLTRGDASVSVVVAAVSPEFFSVLGASAKVGRTFAGPAHEEDDTLVLSYAFWRDRLGEDPAVVGRTIDLDYQTYTIVGIMPKGFSFPVGVEVWRRLVTDVRTANNRTSHQIRLAGRLRPGVTMANANAELAVIADGLAARYPDTNKGWGLHAIPLSELITGRMTEQYLVFLLGGVVFVLVMACANVANLLLARGATRQNEIAVRQALGATRVRLVSLLLSESTLIGIIGAALSLPLATVALNLIRGNMPAEVVKYIPGFESIQMDRPAILLALSMAALSGILAGITPALRVSRCDVNEVLKASGRSGTASRDNTRVRALFLIGEVALAMVLLVGTGLMVKGVHSLSNVNPGTAPATILTMWLDPPTSHYPDTLSCEHFYSRLLDKLQGVPGVDSSAMGSNIPYGGQGIFLPFASDEGSSNIRAGERPNIRVEAISTGYFGTLRIKLQAGRNFNSGDRAGAPPVAIVSEGLANRFWPNQNPVGRRIQLDSLPGAQRITIIGIVTQLSFDWLDEPSAPVLYLASSQYPRRANFVLVRSPRPRQLIGAVRERVHSIDPTQAVLDVKTWDTVIAESMIGLSYVAVIMTVLGGIALLLASFGLFGLMAYNVQTQRHELGLRVALGATAPIILRMVLGRAFLLTGSGIVIGTGGALLMSRLLSNLIFGVNAFDVTVYSLPAGALLIVGLAAAYLPAHQASRTKAIRG